MLLQRLYAMKEGGCIKTRSGTVTLGSKMRPAHVTITESASLAAAAQRKRAQKEVVLSIPLLRVVPSVLALAQLQAVHEAVLSEVRCAALGSGARSDHPVLVALGVAAAAGA